MGSFVSSSIASFSLRGMVLAVGVLTVTQACASENMKGDMKMGDAAQEEITFGEAGKAGDVDRTITVNMQDTAYDLKNLTVKNGETIRFIIVNKDETEHEFTLGPADVQAADRADMAKNADAGKSMEMAVPYAVSVGDLETKELIWKFKGPGEIEFDCNVPGHYEAGMTGKITITN